MKIKQWITLTLCLLLFSGIALAENTDFSYMSGTLEFGIGKEEVVKQMGISPLEITLNEDTKLFIERKNEHGPYYGFYTFEDNKLIRYSYLIIPEELNITGIADIFKLYKNVVDYFAKQLGKDAPLVVEYNNVDDFLATEGIFTKALEQNLASVFADIKHDSALTSISIENRPEQGYSLYVSHYPR